MISGLGRARSEVFFPVFCLSSIFVLGLHLQTGWGGGAYVSRVAVFLGTLLGQAGTGSLVCLGDKG